MEDSTLSTTPPTSPKHTLTTLPPELLLHIISFLPCSSLPSLSSHTHIRSTAIKTPTSPPTSLGISSSQQSYASNTPPILHHSTILSLLLTSPSLHTFISTHLVTIFNSHIRTHHGTTSHFFHPALLNDWFVPKGGEEGLQERGFRTWLGREDADGVWRERQRRSDGGGRGGREDEAAELINLSMPAPWFARFLEECNFEIRIHVEVVRAKIRTEMAMLTSPTLAPITDGNTSSDPTVLPVHTSTEKSQDAKSQQEVENAALMAHPDLAFRLGRYCVRPFLLRINMRKREEKEHVEVIVTHGEYELECEWNAGCGSVDGDGDEDGRNGDSRRKIDRLRESLRKVIRKMPWRRRGNRESADGNRWEVPRGRKLCFGEIERELDEEEEDDGDDETLTGLEDENDDERGAVTRQRWRRLCCGTSFCTRLGRNARKRDEDEKGEHDSDDDRRLTNRAICSGGGKIKQVEERFVILMRAKVQSAVGNMRTWRGCGGAGGGVGRRGIRRFEVLE